MKVTVYHGGISEVDAPSVKAGRRNLDFGQGFYITRILSQAREWAERTARQQLSRPVISVYEFDDATVSVSYRYLRFECYDSEWLHFIVNCRNGYDPSGEWDCVEGGVANDRVIDTVEGFINGTIDESHALAELSRHQPNNQICILSQKIIENCLTFRDTI